MLGYGHTMSMEIDGPQVGTLPIVFVFCNIFGTSVIKEISAVVRGKRIVIVRNTCAFMVLC